MRNIDKPQTETPSERLARTGVGSSFFAGSADLTVEITGSPKPRKIESEREYLDRLLVDLNGENWITPTLRANVVHYGGTEEWAKINREINRLGKNYRKYLRDLIDLWIGTGKDTSTGIESPLKRKPTKRIFDIVERVCSKHGIIPIPFENGYAPGFPHGFLSDNGDDGVEKAELQFAELLFRRARSKVAKCVKCESYFMLKQPGRPFKDGTACSKCNSESLAPERSRRSKKSTRRNLESDLYSSAVQKFRLELDTNPTEWVDDDSLCECIVSYLSGVIKDDPDLMKRYPRGVKRQWLSLAKNRNGINKLLAAR